MDGEEGLLQEADPLFLLLLRLLKDGLHLLHVARRVGRHFLQGLLVVISALRSQEQFCDELCYEATDRALMFFSCFVFTETELECISHLKLSAVPMWCSVNTVRGIIITHVHAKEVFRTGIRGRGSCLQLTTPQLNKYQRTQQTGDTSLECHMLDPLTGETGLQREPGFDDVRLCSVFGTPLTSSFCSVALSLAQVIFRFFSGLISASSFACFSLSRAVCSFWQDL